MRRLSKTTTKGLLLVFAGWFIGVSVFYGYSLLNDADFLATLPQVENQDLDGFSSILNAQLSLIVPTLTPIFLLIDSLALRSFTQTFSLERINPILRC
jgi:hypothetical protein